MKACVAYYRCDHSASRLESVCLALDCRFSFQIRLYPSGAVPGSHFLCSSYYLATYAVHKGSLATLERVAVNSITAVYYHAILDT